MCLIYIYIYLSRFYKLIGLAQTIRMDGGKMLWKHTKCDNIISISRTTFSRNVNETLLNKNNFFMFYCYFWYIWTTFQGGRYFTLEIHYLKEWKISIIERQSSVRRKGYCRSKIHYTYYKQLCISLGNLKRKRLHIFCVCLIWLNDVQSQLHNQGCFISLWEVESQFEKSEIVV